MRIIIIVLLSFISFTGYGQTIVKGAGILYTSGVPSHDPGAKGSEVAIDTLTNSWYQWTGAAWVERGFTDNQVISIDSVAGSYVKHYTATLEDGGSIKWRDSFPSGSDNQVISIDSTSGSSVKYYTATLEDGGTISWRDSFPSGGSGISGGVAGYLPQYTSATALDTTGLYWANSILTLNGPSGLATFRGGELANYQSAIAMQGRDIIVKSTDNVSGGWSAYNWMRLNGSTSPKTIVFNPDDRSDIVFRILGAGSSPYLFNTDPANERIGVGQNTPTARLHVTGSGSSSLTELLLGEKSDGVDVIKANNGGQVAIGAGAYTTSTVLDVQSTNAVLAPPRMTTAQRDLIPTPPNGGIIFCTDCTATDGSTGVSQTYSSSAWRNHY